MKLHRFAIDHLFIVSEEGAGPEDGRAFVVARGSDAGSGRADARALHHAGDAGIIEERDQGLAAAAFRHVKTFWFAIHWIAERAVEWSAPVSPETVIDRLVPDLLDNIEAAALAVSDGPRPNPGTYCDRCSYRELCPASRELRYEPVEYYEDDED